MRRCESCGAIITSGYCVECIDENKSNNALEKYIDKVLSDPDEQKKLFDWLDKKHAADGKINKA